jgi:cysteine synthase B
MRSIVDAVGQTPLLRLHSIGRDVPNAKLFLKLEYTNPGGSVKDRPALQMMKDAIADGRLTKDKILIDATSGNTGVAYSIFGAALGYRIALVMPKNVSQARKNITKAYGTELIFSDPMEGSDGAIRLCRKLVDENPGTYFYSDQYRNPSNPRAHYLGTAAEILEQAPDITHFVTGLGTSGTCMGVTRRLHEHPRKIICVAAEPAEALHGLEGLKHMGSSIVPEIYDEHLPDEHMPIKTEDGWDMADRLAREEGLHVGHSTGANVFGALELAKRDPNAVVVTIACDRGDRYFAPMRWEKHYEW